MDIMNWSSTQSHILTGGGILNSRMISNVHYRDPEDLPHYFLKQNNSHEAFYQYLLNNRRSNKICGAWSRPIFSGGWMESCDYDTEAFNLQTPSIFLDLRFPINRPIENFKTYTNISEYSIHNLQILSRQHCFGGYSLLEESTAHSEADPPIGPVFTRFHVIDWNYHPSYPRPRPNRWWVDIKEDNSSFKEFSITRDEFGIPVYYERWHRYAGDSNGKKYLAMRRKQSSKASRENNSTQGDGCSGCDGRDGLLVVVGNHFACAVDRARPFPEFPGSVGPGGPALVDFAVAQIEQLGLATDAALEWKNKVASYLDLDGSYGRIREVDDESSGADVQGGSCDWLIRRCTHPWREGQSLWSTADFQVVHPRLLWKESSQPSAHVAAGDTWDASLPSSVTLLWGDTEWEALECSFTFEELSRLFPQSTQLSRL